MKIPNKVQENFYELVKLASEKGEFSDWVNDLLEWNSVRFFTFQIDEDTWKGTKLLIEERISSFDTII